MIEECHCCGAYAPSWDSEEYLAWEAELTPESELLGVICPGCFAGEGLAFLHVELHMAAVLPLRRTPDAGSAGGAPAAEAA